MGDGVFKRVGERVRVVNGLDVYTGTYDARYKGPSFGQREGNPYEDSGGEEEIGAQVTGVLFQPGVYSDVGFDVGRFTLNTALRADYYHEIKNYSLDPRECARVK